MHIFILSELRSFVVIEPLVFQQEELFFFRWGWGGLAPMMSDFEAVALTTIQPPLRAS